MGASVRSSYIIKKRFRFDKTLLSMGGKKYEGLFLLVMGVLCIEKQELAMR
jgi:hypothetical protein